VGARPQWSWMTPQSAPANPHARHTTPAEAIPFVGEHQAGRRSSGAPGRTGVRLTHPGGSAQEKAPTIRLVTAKERLHKLVDELSEQEANAALDDIASRCKGEDRPGDVVDEWGNLSAMRRASSARKLRRLAEEEAAAGYEGFPQTAEEDTWAKANAREAIREEPW
jgi:hypothetical protein